MSSSDLFWRQPLDDALVEKLIDAMQRATVVTVAGAEPRADPVMLPLPEVATALLNLLASVLAPLQECQTPAGVRKHAESAGRELLTLMRGYRELMRPPEGGVTH